MVESNRNRFIQLWATVAVTAFVAFSVGCAKAPYTGGSATTPIDTTAAAAPSLTDSALTDSNDASVPGFSTSDYNNTGFAVNVPQTTAFVPSMVRDPSKVGVVLVNEFPTFPILVDNQGILRTLFANPSTDTYGAVHFRHSLYDVYFGMQVAVDYGFPNAITVMTRHHVTPSTYGVRAHCFVGCRLNTQLGQVQAVEDVGGVTTVRGSRPMNGLTGTLETIAYKSNFGCYYNGQFVGASYASQFQESDQRNAYYGVSGQSFRATKAVVVDLFEASKKVEIPWFVDTFDRNQYGAVGLNYVSPTNAPLAVVQGALVTASVGTSAAAPVYLDGTGNLRSQDVRAEIKVGTFGKAGVMARYLAGRGYVAFVDCNGTCAIRVGALANNVFYEAQSVVFNGADYPNIGFGWAGSGRVRMTVSRNQAGQDQINVYLNEQLALSWRPQNNYANGAAGVYLQQQGAIDSFKVADLSQ